MTRVRVEIGMTLVEMLVAIVIGLLVLGTGVAVFGSFLTRATSAEGRTDAQDAVRLAVDQIAIQLRSSMSEGTPGSQPVVSVSDYALVFLAPKQSANMANNPLGLQYIRYCLGRGGDGKAAIYRQTAPYDTGANRNPPSTSGCPGGGWPKSGQAARFLVNSDLNVPLFTPRTDSAGNVTAVGIHAAVDVDPTRGTPATHLRTSVELRNVNRPPIAALTCQPAANGYALCDASASTDPDGQSLAYSWSMNGAALADSGYRLSRGGLVPGRSYVFAVRVTDSGSAQGTASETVTMP
jgi:hypothetical protein